MAILRAQINKGSNHFGIQAAKIDNFHERSADFAWADVYLTVEFMVEGSKYTRPCKIVGSFDKNPDGTIDANSSLLRKITYFCDAIGWQGGVNQNGEWVDDKEEPISDIAAYLNEHFATEDDMVIYIFKERGKDGKVYTRVHNRFIKHNEENKKDLQSFIDWMKSNGYHKEVDPSETNGAPAAAKESVEIDGLDVTNL